MNTIDDFNWINYVENYIDLQKANINTKEKAYEHWINHGKKENRTYIKLKKNNFNWKQYIFNYVDLIESKINTQEKAYKHWITYGEKEFRVCNNDISDINNEIENMLIEIFDKKLKNIEWEKYDSIILNKNNLNFIKQFFNSYKNLNLYEIIIKNKKNLTYFNTIKNYVLFGFKDEKFKNIKELHFIEPFYKNKQKENNENFGNVQFSIIIRTSNRPIYFKECILSILNQNIKNVDIYVTYDDINTFEYLKEYTILDNIKFFGVKKNEFKFGYNLYFNEIYNNIEKSSWIIHLDDDNFFVNNDVLKYLSNEINKNENKIFIWKHNIITNILPENKKTGSGLDTNMFTVHTNNKNFLTWTHSETADNELIENLSKHLEICWLDKLLTSINTYYKNPHNRKYGLREDKYIFEQPSIDSLDFDFYKKIYPDIKINNIKNHWIENGYNEGRLFRLKNFNFDLFNKYYIENYLFVNFTNQFILITSIYNTGNEERNIEIFNVLKLNVLNNLIKEIIIFYEKSDLDTDNYLDEIKKINKIKLIIIESKLNFVKAIEYSNLNYDGYKIIIANSDILITNTFQILKEIKKNVIISLTRYEIISNEKIEIRNKNNQIFDTSQDTWIYQSPLILNNFDNSEIYMGNWNCENQLNKLFLKNNFLVYNICRELITIHLHNKGNRYVQNLPIPFTCPIKLNYLCEI